MSGCDLEQSVAEMLYNKKFLHLKKERKKIFGFGVNPHYPVPQNINSLPPISYRLAKALDTGYYRNTMLDIFLRKKGQVRSMSPVVTIGIPNQWVEILCEKSLTFFFIADPAVSLKVTIFTKQLHLITRKDDVLQDFGI